MAKLSTACAVNAKIAVFRQCFSGLDHVYGTYNLDTGKTFQVKQPVTDDVTLRHLDGIQPYGVYLLTGDRTTALVADFDQADPRGALRFIGHANHHEIAAYLERSKRRGWHVWIFLDSQGVLAGKARAVAQWILEDIGAVHTEVFPKQDRLRKNTLYGNFIAAPLFGRLVPQERTVFLDPWTLRPLPDQWEALSRVQRVSESLFDELIEINGLPVAKCRPLPAPRKTDAGVTQTYGLPPCAQRMLGEGVTEYQRVACFRLAVHLKKAGIPQDIALAALQVWAAKNRPAAGKRIITETEILEQTFYAFKQSYRGCGCQDPGVRGFCHEICPVFKGQPDRQHP